MASFSHSKIASFRKCPRAFEFRYLRNEPERFSTIERHMGSSVHEALRWLYEERLAGREAPRAALAERYEAAWAGPGLAASIVVKNGLGPEDYRESGRRMVLGYHEGPFREDRSETLLLEQSFRIPLREGLLFTGIIDRVAREVDGRLRISDYKTGSRVADPTEDPQLAYYALYVLGAHPDDEVELAYEDLRNGRTLSATLPRERTAGLERQLIEAIAEIESAQAYEPRPSVLCRWCGYNPICDAAEGFVARTQARASGSDRSCPECGAYLRERNGRFGSFIGCTAYPDCRYTRDAW